MAPKPSTDVLEIDLSAFHQRPASHPVSERQSDFRSAAAAPQALAAGSAASGAIAEPSPLPVTAAPKEGVARQVMRDVLETAILTVAIFLLARAGIQSYRITGTSMAPNFLDQQLVIVNKLAYLLSEPQRGDVIVFSFPDGNNRDFIKRVIGVPGDIVEIVNGQVYINGFVVTEPYERIPNDYDAGPTLVGTDKLYVLGDNRADSEDSHLWGLLDQSNLVGKAWLSVWPTQAFGLVEHLNVSIQLPLNP